MKTVRIMGTAPNLRNAPPPPDGVEVWCANSNRSYRRRNAHIVQEDRWTRWFNLHGKPHMIKTYPETYNWYKKQTKPIIMQRVRPDIPASQAFPREAIQNFFPSPMNAYFTCSGSWLIALAIMEGFERIELWGFEIRPTKPAFAWERPNVFFWIEEAKKRGVDVWLPPELRPLAPDEKIGDPATYNGPLYGYDTKMEIDWNPVTKTFMAVI